MGKSTLTKEVQAQIVEILEEGNYQKTAYESLGIPKSNYFYWLKEGEKAETKEGKLTKTEEAYLDFLDSIKRAVQVARQKQLKVIQDVAQGGSIISEVEYLDDSGKVSSKKTVYSNPCWQAAAWFLERTAFEEFGNKSKLGHSNNNKEPMQIKVIYE